MGAVGQAAPASPTLPNPFPPGTRSGKLERSLFITVALLAAACSTSTPPGGANGSSAPTDTSSPGLTDSDQPGGPDTGNPGDTGSPPANDLYPPLDSTSGGSGGSDYPSGTSLPVADTTVWVLAPPGTASTHGVPMLVVISGTEGGDYMLYNMEQVAPYFGLGDALILVLDGRWSDSADTADALDWARQSYDVDNDRTWLLSESAGTRAGLDLAFHDRPTYFAAYWANDVNASDTPELTAQELGFAPWGNAGPGGDYYDAQVIVDGMRESGWQLPDDAPYSGAGSDTHGSTQQFLEAVAFFSDKERG